MEIGNFEDLPDNLGVPLWGRATVWWCSMTLFFPFHLSLKFMCTPTLKLVLDISYKGVLSKYTFGQFCSLVMRLSNI